MYIVSIYAGKNKGAQSIYKKSAPNAIYFHCASHSLNLALSATTTHPMARMMIDNLQKLGIFFKYSPKRHRLFSQHLAAYNETLSRNGKPTINSNKVSSL